MNEEDSFENNPCLVTTRMKVFGLIIQTCRKQKNITQKTLGRFCGVTDRQWSKVEAGEAVLTIDQMYSFCEFFHIKPSVFFSQIDEVVDVLNSNNITVVSANEIHEDDIVIDTLTILSYIDT